MTTIPHLFLHIIARRLTLVCNVALRRWLDEISIYCIFLNFLTCRLHCYNRWHVGEGSRCYYELVNVDVFVEFEELRVVEDEGELRCDGLEAGTP